MRRGSVRLSLLAVVPLLLGPHVFGQPVQEAPAAQDAAEKNLRIRWDFFPETLEPQQTDIGQGSMAYLVFEGLTRLDEELSVVPAAAESWEFNADATVWTFRLREGLVYDDGTPLTAERFRFALERACDPHFENFDVTDLFVIAGCEKLNTSLGDTTAAQSGDELAYEAAKAGLGVRVVDDRTLEYRLGRPTPYFPAIAIGGGFLPVKRELIAAGGPEWWRDPANWVGNGPFRVVAIEPDAPTPRIAFAPNEHYWGGRAKLDGIEYLVIEDPVTALVAYQRGEVDVTWPLANDMPAIEADPLLSREILSTPSTYTDIFLLNLTKEPFTDKKVREAFAYAFDRAAYCRDLEFGYCTPTLSWMPPGVPGSIETDAYAFDPERARQALAESSYGGPENLPEVVWYYFDDPEDPWYKERSEWLAAQYRQVLGVELVLTPVADGATDAMLWVDTATWPQIGSFFWYADLPDAHGWMQFWVCGHEAFAVYIGYCNPEFDALVARADSELDPARRLALFEEAGRLLVADAPSIFISNPISVVLVKPHVTGYSRVAPNQQWPGWWTPLTIDLAPAA